MENKKSERAEIPEELELQAGLLAQALMKMPPRSREEIEEEWRIAESERKSEYE
ncbi:MAG: hypothetical protein OXI07_05055 [Gammaproteobacteria bacterium]|nr:hypothetical protein [Gammaproteobacteria bacterium]